MTSRLARALATVLASPVWIAAEHAEAAEYEVFVEVKDEHDLYELYINAQISQASYITLVELLRRGTDLNTVEREDFHALPNLTYAEVDRALAYRDKVGNIHEPSALVVAGVLSQRKLAAIAPFLVVERREKIRGNLHGFVQYQTVWLTSDRRAPPMVLQARLQALQHLTVGMAGALSHNRIGRVHYDPNRDALSAKGPSLRPWLPKAFIQWDTPSYGIIAGSYRAGFGQKLTFDTSGRQTPNGFYLDDAYVGRVKSERICKDSDGEIEATCDRDRYGSPDYSFRYGLLGAAAGAKHIALPAGWLQIYGLFNLQPRSIYQYQVYDTSICDNPKDDADPNCAAPLLYKTPRRPLDATTRLASTSLPNAFALILGGGNVSWFRRRRTHVGVTAYGAAPIWNVDGAALGFQEWSPFPFGGPFGAIGADASWGRGWADIFAEFARSFDNEGGDGGGYAGIVRHTATVGDHELEISARYYDKAFNNPFARPIGAFDQNAGVRASNEAGTRIRYNALSFDRWSVRALFDIWSDVDNAKPKLRFYVRNDIQATKWLRPGLWLELQDRDLANRHRGECFYAVAGTDADIDENNSAVPADTGNLASDDQVTPVSCTGERHALTARARVDPHRRTYFALQYMHEFVDDPDYPGNFRQDANALVTVATNPLDRLHVRMRWRYRSDDIANRRRYEESIWGQLDGSYQVASWFTPRVRYDMFLRLDRRESTLARVPNPEHWLWFEVESRF